MALAQVFISILFQKGISEIFQFREKVQLQDIEDNDGQNLLVQAALKCQLDFIKSLLKHEFNADDAIDLAWKTYLEYVDDDDKKRKIDKIILELFKSNARMPEDFEYDKASKGVKKFIEKCESMHRDVDENKFDELKLKLQREPKLIHFYNRNNQSLLGYAILNKKYQIFDYLDRGLTIGSHEDLKDIYKDMVSEKKARPLRLVHQKNSQVYDCSHLLALKLNSRIGNNDQYHLNRWNLIEEALVTINSNSYCSKILKVAAECKKLKIYFDFKHDSTYYLDPATSTNSFGIIYSGGTIFIGAKKMKEEKFKVFGVLIHELCHLATLLTFMNPEFDPFSLGESKEKIIYENQVMQQCHYKKDLEPIVKNVFDSYQEKHYNSEMIVTYPQVLMTSFEDKHKVEKFEEDFSELVMFSKEVVEPELDKALSVLKDLNNEEINIKYENLTEPMKAKILHSFIKFQDAQTTFFELFGNDKDILNHLTSDDIRKILVRKNQYYIGKSLQQKLDYEAERHFLSQTKIIELEKTKLNNAGYTKFVENNRKTFNQIIDETEESKIFVLSDHAGTGKTTFFEQSIIKLKQNFRNNWISFINLRKIRYIVEESKNVQDNLSSDEVVIILMKIIDINSKMEKKIFTKLFNDGRVILLFDGFDEISPFFTEKVICIFKSLITCLNNEKNDNIVKNQLWISTRPYCASKIEQALNATTHCFAPLAFDEKQSLMDKILTAYEITIENQRDEIKEKVLKVIFKNVDSYLEINNIMMIKMIVELYIDNINITKIIDPNNIAELYSAMIKKQKEKLGEKIPNSDRDNDSKLTVWDVHRVLALILIFGNNLEINIEEFSIIKKWRRDKKHWTSDLIQRYGFVVVNLEDSDERNSIEFIHRTYAEFFVAEFIIKFLYDDDHDETNDKEVLRIVNLYFAIMTPKNENDFEKIRIFVVNNLIRRENRQVHEKVKKLIFQKIQETHKWIAMINDFSSYCLPYTFFDLELSKKFWKLDKDFNLLEELMARNLKYVTLLAEISFGSNWHEIFNKSNKKLITDEEIDKMPQRNEIETTIHNARDFNSIYGTNFDMEKNYLKLCDLIYKSFPQCEKIRFFSSINVSSSFYRSSIQIEIISKMKTVLDKTTFIIELLKFIDLVSIYYKTLEFIYQCIDEVFVDDLEELWTILFRWDWNRLISPLIKSFQCINQQVLELTIEFYKRHKKSWTDIQNILANAEAEDFLNPIYFELYSLYYRKFIEDVYGNDTKIIREKIEKYISGPQRNKISNMKKYSLNNLKDFLLYVYLNNQEEVERVLSKIN